MCPTVPMALKLGRTYCITPQSHHDQSELIVVLVVQYSILPRPIRIVLGDFGTVVPAPYAQLTGFSSTRGSLTYGWEW